MGGLWRARSPLNFCTALTCRWLVGSELYVSDRHTTVIKLVMVLVIAWFISASVGTTRSTVFSASESSGSVPFFVTQGCS